MVKKGRKRVRGKCQKCGLCTQMAICVLNGFVWMYSILFFGIGLTVGLYTRTLSIWEDFNYVDWVITTPATIFIFYGVLLFFVAIAGCFASVSANGYTTTFYILLIVVVAVFDILLGICFALQLDSYTDFLDRMKDSENDFQEEAYSFSHFGAIPYLTTPGIFWNSHQKKAKCCGLLNYNEWKDVPYGEDELSIPDGCCIKYYEGCGKRFWDPDGDDDDGGQWIPLTANSTSLVYDRGCLSVFPKILQEDSNQVVNIFGKVLFAFLLSCLVLAFVLLILVLTGAFRPSTGLTNPEFMQVPIDPVCILPPGRSQRKVHPEPQRPKSSNAYHSTDESDMNGNRRVSFDENKKGPPQYRPKTM